MYFIAISRRDAILARHVVRMIGVTATVLGALFAASRHAQAASFPCRYSVSTSEKMVCEDPELSLLDDKLAALYSQAKYLAPDIEALEADRISQWSWRQRQCKDKACVSNWYIRRIAELNADIQQGQQAQIRSLKANLTAQGLFPDAQNAVLELKGVRPPSDTGKQ